jgi:hypothetical protein
MKGSVHVIENEMGKTRYVHGNIKNAYNILVTKPKYKRALESPKVIVKIILKRILEID